MHKKSRNDSSIPVPEDLSPHINAEQSDQNGYLLQLQGVIPFFKIFPPAYNHLPRVFSAYAHVQGHEEKPVLYFIS